MIADPEIVRKVAEALEVALDAAYDSSMYRWPQQEDIPPIAAAVLAVAEPLIREQIAQEIEASRATNTFRTTVLERAAEIARGGQ